MVMLEPVENSNGAIERRMAELSVNPPKVSAKGRFEITGEKKRIAPALAVLRPAVQRGVPLRVRSSSPRSGVMDWLRVEHYGIPRWGWGLGAGFGLLLIYGLAR